MTGKRRQQLTESKYAQYLTQDCIIPNKAGDRLMMSTRQMEKFGAGNFSLDCIYILDPRVVNEKNHSHTFDQYLCFFAGNPNNVKDFDAEIEMYMGEEQEKLLITAPTVIHIPAGLHHCPLKVTRLNKPLLFIDIAMTARYAQVGDVKKS
jgi:hypothetical protein